MYNEKLKRAYIRVNYVSKSKVQESEDKAEVVTQRRGWLLLWDLIPPQCFCTPITQAAKEPNLSPAPLRERRREPEVEEPSPQKFACNKAEALVADNLSSDTPKFWHKQNLLRILTERGRNTPSPLSKRSVPLNLCLLCPYLTTLSLRRTRRLCGGKNSFSPTLASSMMY